MKHFLWDFHAEGGAKSLDKQWNMVGVSVEQLGHYCSETKTQQGGVVRINCMDCLDRSNVTQAWLGARMMTRQLHSLVPDVKEMTAGRLADLLTQMWVSNGNQLSKLYAGTAALSQVGSKLMDGARSVSRTIQNNLLDRDKQEQDPCGCVEQVHGATAGRGLEGRQERQGDQQQLGQGSSARELEPQLRGGDQSDQEVGEP